MVAIVGTFQREANSRLVSDVSLPLVRFPLGRLRQRVNLILRQRGRDARQLRKPDTRQKFQLRGLAVETRASEEATNVLYDMLLEAADALAGMRGACDCA